MPEVLGRIGWREARTAEVAESPPRAESLGARTGEGALVARFVYVAVALYAVTFAILSILQHESFQTQAFDLGNMDQAVWNTAHGRPLEFTNWTGGNTRLAAHVEPILFLVALAYHVYSSPVVLLILQSCITSLGALPAFWLARDVLRNSFAAVVFSFSYLLAPALEIANLADFHAVAFSSALLLFAFYYVYRSNYVGFLLVALLALATKEHVALSVFVVGLYIALVQKRPRMGYATCFLAGIWAFIAFGVVIPHFNPAGVSPYLSRYDQLGKTPLEMAITLLTDPVGTALRLFEPAKAEYVLNLLSPTLYLALLSPATLAMALPDLAINLLSNFPEMYAGRAHYGAVIVPFVTISAVLGAGAVRKGLERLHPTAASWGTTMIAVLVLVSSLGGFYTQVFLPLTDHLPRVTAHHRLAKEIIALIPPGAAVSASSTLNPHISQRRHLSLFPEIGAADYIFLDVTATPYPIDLPSQWYRVQQLLGSGEWGIVVARDGYLLLRRGAEAHTLPEEFFTFARGDLAGVETRLALPFGSELVLMGYSLEPGTRVYSNDPYARLTLFWQADAPPSQDFLISVSVVGEEDQTIYTDRYQATTLWYPPTRWPAGAVVKVEVPWLPLGATDRAELRVSLVDRERPYRPLSRLFPTISESTDPAIFRDGGAAIRLTMLEKG